MQGKEAWRGIPHDSQILSWRALPRDGIRNRGRSFRVEATHPCRDVLTLRCWQDIQGSHANSRRVWAPRPLQDPGGVRAEPADS